MMSYVLIWAICMAGLVFVVRPMLGTHVPLTGFLMIFMTIGLFTINDGSGMAAMWGTASLFLSVAVLLIDGLMIWNMQKKKRESGEFEDW